MWQVFLLPAFFNQSCTFIGDDWPVPGSNIAQKKHFAGA